MGFVFISDDDKRYFYQGFRIFRSEVNSTLWGIKSPNNEILIQPVYNEIEWFYRPPSNKISDVIVKFRLNEKSALCHFNDLLTLK